MSGRGAISDVPFLPEVRIERDADALIAEYAHGRGVVVAAPVPVEDILELHIGLTFAIEDLAALFGTQGVLGAIWFNEKLVRIDTGSIPPQTPHGWGDIASRSRTRSATGGSIARITAKIRRRPLCSMVAVNLRSCVAPATNRRLSGRPTRSPATCSCPSRSSSRRGRTRAGSLDPVVLADLPPVLVADGRDPANTTLDRFSKPLAERFEVSAEAMRIRLEKLGLLMRERPNTLF